MLFIQQQKDRMVFMMRLLVVFYLYSCCFKVTEGLDLSDNHDSFYSEEFSKKQESLLRELDRLFPGDYLNPFVNVHERSTRSVEGSTVAGKRTAEEDACKPMVQGEDLDVESFPVGREENSEMEWRHFADDAVFNRVILGSLVFVKNPFYSMSVLEPSYGGSCSVSSYFTPKASVTDTAKNRKGGCKVAVNAGYFIPATGKCLGNIVSEGRVVQRSKNIRNANFGIRNDGSFVTGYMPDSKVGSKGNPFRQLVSGVIWLVRNGTNYVNVSMREECRNLQNTGTMKVFVEIVSARTAVGHDKQGRMVIAKIEGQSLKRGVNLYEFADLLIKHDVWNAINLDGGGSSQLVVNHTLVSYPSDHCSRNPEYRCERAVSTILCVHDPECLNSCSSHGDCNHGDCHCHPPWSGLSCDSLNCSQTNCSGHGHCVEGKCKCGDGWKGVLCNQTCPKNYYGPGCIRYCYCGYKRNSYCNAQSQCVCKDGFTGFMCDRPCPGGFFGPNCANRCAVSCSKHGRCSPINGHCLCDKGWTGENCSVALQIRVDTSRISSTLSSSIPQSVPPSDVHSALLIAPTSSDVAITPTPAVERTDLKVVGVTKSCQNHSENECNCCHLLVSDTAMSPAAISVLFALGCLSTVVLHVLICVIAQYVYWRRAHSASPGQGRKKKRSYSRLKIDYHSDDSSEH